MAVALNYFVTVTLIGKRCCKTSEQDLFLGLFSVVLNVANTRKEGIKPHIFFLYFFNNIRNMLAMDSKRIFL